MIGLLAVLLDKKKFFSAAAKVSVFKRGSFGGFLRFRYFVLSLMMYGVNALQRLQSVTSLQLQVLGVIYTTN